MPEKCARCGSDKMMEDVHLSEGDQNGQRLVAYVQKDPNALLLKGTVLGVLRARVCGTCGHTEIHTRNFQQLHEAYRQSQGG